MKYKCDGDRHIFDASMIIRLAKGKQSEPIYTLNAYMKILKPRHFKAHDTINLNMLETCR